MPERRPVPLGRLGGLHIAARPSAFAGLALVWLALTIVAGFLVSLSWPQAAVFGLEAALLHAVSELWHQFGHARAAQRTGFPMEGVEFWWIFGASLYPQDEPDLPPAVHLRRAAGGVPYSLMMAGIGALAWLLTSPDLAGPYWLAAFLCLDNLFVFSLGALLPLGFTDGSTILRYWRAR